jgi:hypothetical protein
MDELLFVAVPVALVAAAAAALFKPARQRVMPVAKAAGRAGVAVTEVSVAGARGIVDAAIHGEGKQNERRSDGARAESRRTPSGGARRRPAKSSPGRTRRRSSSSATS